MDKEKHIEDRFVTDLKFKRVPRIQVLDKKDLFLNVENK